MNQDAKKLDPCSPIQVGDVPEWHLEADVIVVGFGGAGSCAALAAAEEGANVILLEAASASGGTTALAGGQIYLGGGTPIQTACGFEDSVEDMQAYLTLAAGENVDPERIELYCRDSVAHYEWLVAQGVEFNPEFYGGKHTNTPEYQSLCYSGNEKGFAESKVARPAPRAHKPKSFWEDGGSTLMEALTQAVEQTDIKVYYDTRVLTLVLDGNEVVGLACRQDGEIRYLKANRGVVLCAGGFVMNQEMAARHVPVLQQATPIGNPNDNGSGILMGTGAGGATLNMGEAFISMCWYPSGEFCKGVFVNEQGNRFVNEDCYHARGAHRILNQTHRKV